MADDNIALPELLGLRIATWCTPVIAWFTHHMLPHVLISVPACPSLSPVSVKNSDPVLGALHGPPVQAERGELDDEGRVARRLS